MRKKAGTLNSKTPFSIGSKKRSDRFSDHPEGAQLSRLGSVLNGLEHGAGRMRRHWQKAMNAVREGTYRVDPLQLSRRIIGEALQI